jgi:hypothetical protein
VSNQVEIIYSSGRNSKETGEIIRISPRKSARGIRPLKDLTESTLLISFSLILILLTFPSYSIALVFCRDLITINSVFIIIFKISLFVRINKPCYVDFLIQI